MNDRFWSKLDSRWWLLKPTTNESLKVINRSKARLTCKIFPEDGELTRGMWDDWWIVKPGPICNGCVPDESSIRCCCCCWSCCRICRLCWAICSCCCMFPLDFDCWTGFKLPAELKIWLEDLKRKCHRTNLCNLKVQSNLEFWRSIPLCMFIVNSWACTLSLFWMSDNKDKSNQDNRNKKRALSYLAVDRFPTQVSFLSVDDVGSQGFDVCWCSNKHWVQCQGR